MKKPKIKFICEVAGTTLLFQILEMDERARRSDLYFEAKNGLTIKSLNHPEIRDSLVFLRGNQNENDFDYSIKKCESEEHAIQYKENLIAALNDWSENWEGWNEETDEEKKEITKDFKVYEF